MNKNLIAPNGAMDSLPEIKQAVIRNHDQTSSLATRLITGQAAEQYFVMHHQEMKAFANLAITDTTTWGCGFDFKLSHPMENEPFIAAEVKGLRTRCGAIQMTDLEYDVAKALRNRYYLVLVRNFAERPFHSVINDPFSSGLRFKKTERTEIRIAWNANIGKLIQEELSHE